ncbi:MBL fold metallo-hydrolase [Chromobacterium vaccinii]|uniref:MBL fold metallo-hydrolase n=1 Tax=Chromobacterium vaccinii TaxID=1108595 RepID=UPI001E2AB655|nr:MBL fold metallo-hydrolase [Chromobacterium vaccinii]MCD4501019.1 MBL fold metallo-hydrolase [Chromobacterium vaccinii]
MDRPPIRVGNEQEGISMKSLGKKASGPRLEKMQASPLWSGSGFRNIYPIDPALRDPSATMPSLRDFLCGGERRAPSAPLPADNPLDAWRKPAQSGLRATWLGHSTVLIEIDGLRLLTDPVWGPRASPTRLAGPKRFQPVPIKLKQLPPLDLVLVSHDHYDHLDYPTIRELAKTDTPFVTALGVGAHLEAFGVRPERITELDWWESYHHPDSDLTVTATPSQHFSGRGLKDRNATLWSSLSIRSARHSVFFSGDTGLSGQFAEIRERMGPFDLVMLEVGAHHPAWGDIHLGPDNALKALDLLGGGAFLPVHWGTFNLAMHAWDAPAESLLASGEKENVRLMMPRLGQAVEPAHAERAHPWWREVDSVAVPSAPIAPEADAPLPKSMPWPLD